VNAASARLLHVPSAAPAQPTRRDELLLMRKSSNLVPNHVVVAPRLSLCSCRGRTHIRVCTVCRRGLDDVRLPVDDSCLPPLATSSTPLARARFSALRTCRCCRARVRSACAVTVHLRYFARVARAIGTH
jgi:hypothetical protein